MGILSQFIAKDAIDPYYNFVYICITYSFFYKILNTICIINYITIMVLIILCLHIKEKLTDIKIIVT